MRIESPMREIEFSTRKLVYNIHRQDRDRLRIVVQAELTVDVFAPQTAT